MTAQREWGGRLLKAMVMAATLMASLPAHAFETQPEVDRSDPALAIEEAADAAAQRPTPPERSDIVAEPYGDVTTPAQAVLAGAIRVDGATALPQSAFAPAIEPYLGRELTPDELRALVRAIADVARHAGFGLATSWIPQQNLVNGILRVRIDEGRIDAIDARGPAAEIVHDRLTILADGAPVRTAALERRLLIAGDAAGVTVRRARLVKEGERNVLRVDTRYDGVEGRVTLDNWGTSSLGPVRLRIVADVNGVLGRSDRVTLGGSITPLQPREFQFLQLGYAAPAGNDGTELAIRTYASASQAGGALSQRDLDGVGRETEAGISRPLLRSRTANLWAYAFAGIRDSRLDADGRRLRDERITWASASLYGWARFAGGTLRTRIALVQGLDAFNATGPGDRFASRRDAGSVFTKATFWTDYTRSFGDAFSVQLSSQGQLASRPLLASEEIGLGGRAFLRGYDYREFSGDRGGAGAIELRYDLASSAGFIRRAQLYVYGDAGRVTNLRGGFGSGSLVSTGGGVRFTLRHRIDAGLELGIPLRDGFDSSRPDPRFSFTLGARF